MVDDSAGNPSVVWATFFVVACVVRSSVVIVVETTIVVDSLSVEQNCCFSMA